MRRSFVPIIWGMRFDQAEILSSYLNQGECFSGSRLSHYSSATFVTEKFVVKPEFLTWGIWGSK